MLETKMDKAMNESSAPEAMKKSSTSAAPPTSSSEDCESGLPIDRGYAWVIVFACLFSNIICLGLQRAYGILFVEFLHLYNMPVGITSLVMSVQSAFTSVSALLTQTVMLSLLSERQTMIIGAVCGSVGITLSYFASTLALLILTQSVLVGAANGMIMGPAMVIVGKYFHKRRSFAMAVAILGGNLGSMTMPLFTEALLEEYGVRGTLLVLGAFFLNIIVFASLLRPLELSWRKVKTRKKDSATAEDNKPLNPTPPTRTPTDAKRWLSAFTLVEEEEEDPKHPSLLRLKSSHLWVSSPELSMATKIAVPTHLPGTDSDDDDEESGDDQAHELRPLRNGQVASEKRSRPGDSPQGGGGIARTPGASRPRRTGSCCSNLLAMLDLRLFRNPAFLLVVASSSLAMVPAALFGMYLPAMAEDKGVTGQRAALLLTIFGGCGIFSRLGFGYLADLNCMRRAYLMALLMSLTCVAALFTPLYDDFALLSFFSMTYGLFGIVFFSLMPVVIVDLVGLRNMTKTLGFVQLFQGATTAVSHPIIGHLRDVTGQYHASYYFMSGAGVSCAFILLFTSLVTRKSPDQSEVVEV